MSRLKKQLRLDMLEKLRRLDESEFKQSGKRIRDRLVRDRLWRHAKVIAVTLSLGREIETEEIIERAWSEAKTVAVPKCHPAAKTLTFHQLDSFDQLNEGYFHLKEPSPEKTRLVQLEQVGLMIVPGVVFDRRGNRIGYGGGYYDRLLGSYRGATVALLLGMQLVPNIPIEAHDQRINLLFTEDERIDTRNSNE
ncbi:MAG: 5-formyltetrahydrofolate cyclo-ligase [Sporolactobacillus sp.]